MEQERCLLRVLSTGWHDPKCPTARRIHAQVTLPSDVSEWVGAYRKLRLRESWDFQNGAAAAWKKGDKSTSELQQQL